MTLSLFKRIVINNILKHFNRTNIYIFSPHTKQHHKAFASHRFTNFQSSRAWHCSKTDHCPSVGTILAWYSSPNPSDRTNVCVVSVVSTMDNRSAGRIWCSRRAVWWWLLGRRTRLEIARSVPLRSFSHTLLTTLVAISLRPAKSTIHDQLLVFSFFERGIQMKN